MTKIIIGVMGPGDKATAIDQENAYQLGELIAQQDWVLLTGGRNVGVMHAASLGAKAANGLTIGILPDSNKQAVSPAVDIAIITDMGNARNNINVLSSDLIIACGLGAGTVSEIALALKAHKRVILLNDSLESQRFCQSLSPQTVHVVNTAQAAIGIAKAVLLNKSVPGTAALLDADQHT